MYPFGSLTAELQSARRKLLDVFEVPDSKATGERRTQGMRNGLGRWLYPILEHGTVPAVALGLERLHEGSVVLSPSPNRGRIYSRLG